MESNSRSKLSTLRRLMVERGIDVYIVPSEDSHHSEYTAPCDARRAYLTGFKGSAGCAVVTADAAILATDGRYFAQATTQLDDNWKLLKQGHPDFPSWQDWVVQQSSGGNIVAVDPTLVSANTAASLSAKIKRSGGFGLTPLYENLIDQVWGNSRPERPSFPVTVHPDRFAGCTVQNKLSAIREILVNKSADALVLSTLDDIAWLFNIRGADIPFNPVFFSYAIVTPCRAAIYMDSSRLTSECFQHLSRNRVDVRPYGAVFDNLQKMSDSNLTDATVNATEAAPRNIMLTHKSSWALTLSIGGDDKITEVRSPVSDLKAIKNAIEVDGMRACHLRDGAAMIKYFAWLEHELVTKSTTLTETQAADKLEEFRSIQDMFAGLSFATVSATGANAAIIHYQPTRTECSVIDPEAVYLCDSGGQYLDGTTDTTRTIHHGDPTNDEKRAYTLVLKGNIALDSAVFPKGTCGFALDCLARQFLRREGLDYRHSTGHGVGSYLNVHEGPIGIGTRPEFADVALQPGNVISNEPGFYDDGNFGVRIENVMLVRQIDPQARNDICHDYLSFECLTMVPLCRKLVDIDLLTRDEILWVNKYHKKILNALRPVLAEDELALDWLRRETDPYCRSQVW